MRNKFSAEDRRKTSLFSAWNSYFERIHTELGSKEDFEFEQIFEGLAHVTEVAKNSMTVQLDEAKSVCKFEITGQISKQAVSKDLIYIVLGKTDGNWLPLDIISVGSLIAGKEMGFHLTINPLHMRNEVIH